MASDNPTPPSAEDLARKSLQCLYLEADSSIADDVREKVFAAFAEIRAAEDAARLDERHKINDPYQKGWREGREPLEQENRDLESKLLFYRNTLTVRGPLYQMEDGQATEPVNTEKVGELVDDLAQLEGDTESLEQKLASLEAENMDLKQQVAAWLCSYEEVVADNVELDRQLAEAKAEIELFDKAKGEA